jgi:hypothetical protein
MRYMHVLALVPPKLKPQLNLILGLFVTELIQLGTQGIPIYDSYKQETRTLYAYLLRTVCDLPARKVVQSIAGPGAYGGCYYCLTPGVHNGRCVCYPDDPPFHLRATADYFDDELRVQIFGYDPNNFPSLARLYSFSLYDAIWDVPLDTMHNCYLGVTRRLFLHWFHKYPSVSYLQKFRKVYS